MNREVRLLFHELLELSPRERVRIYQERRIGAEVQNEVESLLTFDSSKPDDLHTIVSTAAGDGLRTVDGLEWSHCGPYRLIRQLSSDGVGAVYLSEETGGEIQRKVAVKLLRADVCGAAWRESFLRERQLQASLNHLMIVPIIDAGCTRHGRPYLVMEHAEGIPIDLHAAELDVCGRLKIFLQVCDAVSYAHRRLIIHRGLQPSNILVDSSGRAKIVDFGLAKMLEETGDASQTPEWPAAEYASPEKMAGAPQTTATDIYSLGAVLYKLLAGVTPREVVSDEWSGEVTPPSFVHPGVEKDLDFIVWKALRVEPEERYLSVDGFARDLRTVLGRPMKARTGELWVRARRFLRRRGARVTALKVNGES